LVAGLHCLQAGLVAGLHCLQAALVPVLHSLQAGLVAVLHRSIAGEQRLDDTVQPPSTSISISHSSRRVGAPVAAVHRS
jgi:hypothetical protein